MRVELLEALLRARAEKRRVCLVRRLDGGGESLWVDGEVTAGPPLEPPLAAAVEAAVREDRARLVETPSGRVFLEVLNPPLRLVLVGAVHIAQELVPLAHRLGFRPVVVDPRRAFATAERFPGVELVDAWPDEALEALDLDRRTAVVTLTHDPKLDDPALEVALRSPAFYVGALGSRRTHARRVARLGAAGLSEAEIGRIHAPVGLDIGAVGPTEIALAIMAEIIAELRGAPLARRQPVTETVP